MTPEQRQAVEAYIGHLQRPMELADWRFILSDEHPDDPQAGAAITPTYGRRLATIYLEREFFTNPLEKMKHYIIHEMLHCHAELLDTVVKNGLEPMVGSGAWSVFLAQFNAQIEYMTDALAYMTANLLVGDEEFLKALDASRIPATISPEEIQHE